MSKPAAKGQSMDVSVRQIVAKVGYGRQWIESAILGVIGWAVRLVAALTWALIVLIVATIIYWLAARMWGWPTGYVRMNTQELMGIGVFVFCAAFALKSRV